MSRSLDTYRRKRDPAKTPEPFSGNEGGGGEPIFVVQRHDARRLHFDFRIERGGALQSWAVPKGIPLRKGQRHLAVHVEDHPLDYAAFEGEIPAGEYGAGTVEIWDRGHYELVEEKRDGGLTVRLRGERLNGLWTLVPTRIDGDERNWLMIRKDEGEAGGDASDLRPMLAVAASELPTAGDDWVYEVKWDGYRVIAAVDGGEATLRSRNGNDLTGRFAARRARAPRGAAQRRLRARRRGVRARRGWPPALLAAPARRRRARHVRVRPAPARRPRRDRPAAARAPRAARGDAHRRRCDPALGRVRRRPGPVRAGARGSGSRA